MNTREILKNVRGQSGVGADRGRAKVRCFEGGWELERVWRPGMEEWFLNGEPISESEARRRLQEAGLAGTFRR